MGPPVVEGPLFFLDYDGTLAPIVDEPSEAYPHADASGILERLSESHPVVLVTGRKLADLTTLLPLPLEAVGLHGLQRGRIGGEIDDRTPPEVLDEIRRMRETVPRGEGIRVEEKGSMFAVHYRLSLDKTSVRELLRNWLTEVPESLDQIWGKDVVELRPRGVSKGTAVLEMAEQFPGRTPVYIGDDVTDEDAFKALGEDAVTVKVGEGETAAKYRLGDVDDVVEYLRRYVS